MATSTALVLCGVGLGTVGTSLTGRGGPAGAQRHTPPSAAPGAPAAAVSGASPRTMAALGPAETRPGASLGLEAVDARDVGALVTAVHTPGPGYTAGLVRGDILLQFGAARIDTAADLARAVAHAGPGTEVTVTVRHRSGNFQQLTVVPGVVI
ncbi:PDZ domain-containing protein [Streptomyces sp. NPDC005573]|uniref:PDZ domain-containing protein n=1 Tax=Streptomyces sp. NPDC005573 TaxID=3156890 RepID=UPI0033B2AEA3